MFNLIFPFRWTKAKLFQYIDCLFQKKHNKVLFVVKSRTYFSGNLRVVLESFLKYGSHEIYIYKDGDMSPKLTNELQEMGVHVLKSFTLHSIWHILTSGTIILSHNPRDAHITQKCKARMIVNLWHGVAIKQIELLMPNIESKKLKLLHNNSKLYDMVIASSQQDKITNANAFGVSLDKVHITGLPRYEILKSTYQLGTVLQEENDNIIQIKAKRKLILFAPTFRENHTSAIEQITSEEWEILSIFAKKTNILFGIRPHPYDIKYLPKDIMNDPHFHLFENSSYTEPNILLKHTDVLIVDYSSIWIDYLLLHRPIIGFSKDYVRYLEKERGFVYDFNSIFPNSFTTHIEELIETIEISLLSVSPIQYNNSLDLFHKYSLEYDYAKKIYDEIEMQYSKLIRQK